MTYHLEPSQLLSRSMTPLAPYELAVLEALWVAHYPIEHLARVLDEAELVDCEHTGVGYFLTLRSSRLPVPRIVLHEPMITAICAGTILCGFLAFIESGELTLECYTFDGSLPFDARDLAWSPISRS